MPRFLCSMFQPIAFWNTSLVFLLCWRKSTSQNSFLTVLFINHYLALRAMLKGRHFSCDHQAREGKCLQTELVLSSSLPTSHTQNPSLTMPSLSVSSRDTQGFFQRAAAGQVGLSRDADRRYGHLQPLGSISVPSLTMAPLYSHGWPGLVHAMNQTSERVLDKNNL